MKENSFEIKDYRFEVLFGVICLGYQELDFQEDFFVNKSTRDILDVTIKNELFNLSTFSSHLDKFLQLNEHRDDLKYVKSRIEDDQLPYYIFEHPFTYKNLVVDDFINLSKEDYIHKRWRRVFTDEMWYTPKECLAEFIKEFENLFLSKLETKEYWNISQQAIKDQKDKYDYVAFEIGEYFEYEYYLNIDRENKKLKILYVSAD
ncbi:hypothetical protein [Sediminitomix flava]|uniref:Uncharacterized protein n=1 Tax=Sediminitomix flava TaxID=379075 RepID=A0A315YST1_SEDFL|nr:hypothetical protein [Sediminitomix flava]PWJ31533.1 hypothetical protein BC781_1243 [Sediminitomix flava]